MKRTAKIITAVFAAVCAFSSCEDNRLEGMSPDSLYIVQSGVKEVFVNKKDYADFTISVYKAGYGDTKGGASISVDEGILDRYNSENGTSLKLLPDLCYSISKEHVNFAEKTVYRNSTVTIDGSVLNKYQGIGIKKYALPLMLTSDSSSLDVQEKMNYVLIVPVLE